MVPTWGSPWVAAWRIPWCVQGFMYAVATEHYVRLSPDFFAFQHGEPFGRFLILGVAHLT